MGKNKIDSSIKVPQRNKIKNDLQINELYEWTEKQKELISCILDKNTRIVFIDGVAGSSKTYLATYCGLKLLLNKRVSEFLYFRTVVESASKGLGFLPGESCDKFKPFIGPLEAKLDEFLNIQETNALINDKRIRAIPVNYLRGCSFNANYLFADESQNFTSKELVTLLTRIGKFSKLVICGDSLQSDINGASGFKKIFNLFDTEHSKKAGIHCFKLDKTHIVRDEIIKFIIEQLEFLNENRIANQT